MVSKGLDRLGKEIPRHCAQISSVLKWSQSISGVALMPLAPIRMCKKNVLNVQNSLQAVQQLQYIKIAVVIQGAGDGKKVLGRLRPQLAYAQSGGQNQKWPTSGQGGYITPAALGDPHRFKAGGKIRSGPQVGKVAT